MGSWLSFRQLSEAGKKLLKKAATVKSRPYKEM